MTTKIENTKKQIENELAAICNLREEDKQEKLTNIKEMISHYTQSTTAIEGRRENLHSINLQVLAVATAALAIVPTANAELWQNKTTAILLGSLLMIGIILFLFSILAALFYGTQSKFQYPFIEQEKYGNKWKWFYYGNPFIKKIPTCPYWQSPSKGIEPYLEGLSFFIEKYRKENLNSEL